jgi:hypothetical protein
MNKAKRHTLLATLLATGLVAVWPAAFSLAQERRLSAAEIKDKLIGNTIQGLWAGRPYRQFFDGSGRTIYVEDGRQPSMGRWKADAEKDYYCSSWQSSRSACYEVLDGGPDAIIWVLPGSGKKFPATVLQGDQLSTVVQADPVF